MKNKIEKTQFISSFIFKIIAIVTMTFDHVGILLSAYLPSGDPLVETFRIIGRLALPLFCFMIVEGVLHTKHFGKYALKLGIMLTLISIVMSISYFGDIPGSAAFLNMGNIYVDLLLGATLVYCLKRKELPVKLLAIIPLAISLGSMFVTNYELTSGTIVWWFPFFLRTQYQFYGVILCFGYYIANVLKDVLMTSYASNLGLDKDVVFQPGTDRFITNVISFLATIICTLLYLFASMNLTFVYLDVQFVAVISGALLLFYNGKRGYNSKWFQYGCYLYYPVHIGILILIFILTSL